MPPDKKTAIKLPRIGCRRSGTGRKGQIVDEYPLGISDNYLTNTRRLKRAESIAPRWLDIIAPKPAAQEGCWW
ncbi:MAG: hypothetical protein SV487_01120 [Thermodesulfobacteriota bacterium]|nr:hypothetical protein [Thermodesulfobacteriota bacterium]